MKLNKIDQDCKFSFFQLVNTYGPQYIGRYNVSEEDIKLALNYQRSTPSMWQEAINFFEYKGYTVVKTNWGLQLTLTAQGMSSSPNDHYQLAIAIREFRDRAAINGDIENI